MQTQCKRIYSAMPMHCQRICNGQCGTPCVSDASTESRVQNLEKGKGLCSPHPSVSVLSQVSHHLTAGLRMLSDNDHGRPWPNPNRATLRRLIAEHDPDLCIRAARDTREIVQVQDRAPNITGLFEKKLGDLAEVRGAVRGALADVAIVGEREPCL